MAENIEVVPHPETGEPAVAETTYRPIELELERNKLNELEAQLTSKQDEATRVNDELAALESAVGNQKSLIERADGIKSQSNSEASGVADGETTPAEAGDSPVGSDLEGGNAGDGSQPATSPVVPAENVLDLSQAPADEY